MDREAWRTVIHWVAKSQTRLSDWTELKTLLTLCIGSPLFLFPYLLDRKNVFFFFSFSFLCVCLPVFSLFLHSSHPLFLPSSLCFFLPSFLYDSFLFSLFSSPLSPCFFLACILLHLYSFRFFSSGSEARYADLIPASGRFLGGRNASPLWYSCQDNPKERGAC